MLKSTKNSKASKRMFFLMKLTSLQAKNSSAKLLINVSKFTVQLQQQILLTKSRLSATSIQQEVLSQFLYLTFLFLKKKKKLSQEQKKKSKRFQNSTDVVLSITKKDMI